MSILRGEDKTRRDSAQRHDGLIFMQSMSSAAHPSVLSMDSPKRRQLAVSLAYRVGTESASSQIAHWIALMCEDIAATLTPILGKSCIAVVYQRSLHLTGSVHPWLSHLYNRIWASMDLLQLKSLLGQQSSRNAAAAGCTLLQIIRDLLANLIGTSTTERLLHLVWDRFYSGPTLRNEGTLVKSSSASSAWDV